MICGGCHNEIPGNAKYCTVCGMLMVGGGEAREEPEPAREVPAGKREEQGSSPDVGMIPEKGASVYKPRVYVDTVDAPSAAMPYAVQREPEPYKPPEPSPGYSQPYQRQWEYGSEAYGKYENQFGDADNRPSLAPAPDSGREPADRQGNITVTSSGMEKGMTAGQFFLMELLALIPVVGFIVMCVWAFGGGINANRSALARAKLIMMLAVTFILFTVFIVFLILIANNLITLKWLTLG